MQLVHYTTSCPNFGDDLNQDIWPALAPDLFSPGGEEIAFVGIGTILGMPGVAQRRIEVFSTGAGYDPPDGWADRQVNFHCVRGPVTARLMGLDANKILTDGAILTPSVGAFPSRAAGGLGACVIPHFQTVAHGGWDIACKLAGMRLIDPRGTTRDVIASITKADLVITESLHGAILADTYGIPWCAFAASGNISVPKWVDWTASVNLPFKLTTIPPPNATGLLHFGRRTEPFGTPTSFSLDDALTELRQRVAAVSQPRKIHKRIARATLLRMPVLQMALGYSPARTAQALSDLARRDGTVSSPTLRQELAERMMTRLGQIAHTQPSRSYA